MADNDAAIVVAIRSYPDLGDLQGPELDAVRLPVAEQVQGQALVRAPGH